jgi:N-acetyl-anhydromuramyl-L-alanine amidase AmpD
MSLRLEGRRLSLLFAFVALAAAPAGCAMDGDDGDRDQEGEQAPSQSSDSLAGESELDGRFAAAADEFGVPTRLLKAWGYAETRWQMIQGHDELPGLKPAWGIFGLRGATLERAAELAGESVQAVQRDEDAHLRAGAALLADLAAEEGVAGDDDLGAWAAVMARASGIGDAEGQAQFVHDQVYAALNRGASVETELGLVASIAPEAVEPDFPAPRRGAPRQHVDHPGAIWRGSPNFGSRPAGTGVEMVIIHTCEGNYSGCWSWLTNPAAGASAHYVVAEFGEEISQLVHESDRAWHIAADYDCNLNDGVKCERQGQGSNDFTVGIEHGGFASQSSFPEGQIDASAALACDISARNGVPRDRNHFVAHGQLQPWNRTDPGPNWPWTAYIDKINAACGAAGGGELIVDSNNDNNEAGVGEMQVSANWVGTSQTAGYYGSGYYFADTAEVSDGAVFWFHLDEAGPRTIDAWWTSGSNRSSATPFVAFDASGTKLGTAHQDQRSGGGQWNELGTWNFSAGWNSVVVSRWAAGGAVVVADAIRVR